MLRLLLLYIIAFFSMHERTTNLQTNRILIVNAFDAEALHVRKNKMDLFRELTDSLQVYLATDLKAEGADATILPGFSNSSDDSAIQALMISQHAEHAIVIRSLEVYFKEGAEKRRDEYGLEPRVETSYDLCSKINYSLYINAALAKDSQMVDCHYFTSRGQDEHKITIKFGPDIVGKKKHTYGAVQKNAAVYIRAILPMLK
jgi:hypothetical protein